MFDLIKGTAASEKNHPTLTDKNSSNNLVSRSLEQMTFAEESKKDKKKAPIRS